jgi:hypothetical protein
MYWPTVNQSSLVEIISGVTPQIGRLTVQNDGVLSLYAGGGTGFAPSSTGGIYVRTPMTYIV